MTDLLRSFPAEDETGIRDRGIRSRCVEDDSGTDTGGGKTRNGRSHAIHCRQSAAVVGGGDHAVEIRIHEDGDLGVAKRIAQQVW